MLSNTVQPYNLVPCVLSDLSSFIFLTIKKSIFAVKTQENDQQNALNNATGNDPSNVIFSSKFKTN